MDRQDAWQIRFGHRWEKCENHCFKTLLNSLQYLIKSHLIELSHSTATLIDYNILLYFPVKIFCQPFHFYFHSNKTWHYTTIPFNISFEKEVFINLTWFSENGVIGYLIIMQVNLLAIIVFRFPYTTKRNYIK